MGAAISASRQSLGNSRAKLRFRMRVPAKANTIQRRPPDMSRVVSSRGSKAKLKSTRMTRAKANEALMASFVRISARRSLTVITSACRKNPVIASIGLARSRVDVPGIGDHLRRARAVKCHLPAVQQRDMRGQLQGLPQLVGRHHNRFSCEERFPQE